MAEGVPAGGGGGVLPGDAAEVHELVPGHARPEMDPLGGEVSVRAAVVVSCLGRRGYYRLLQVTTGYYRLLQVTTGYYRLLQVTTGYYRLLQVTTGYYMLLDVTRGY